MRKIENFEPEVKKENQPESSEQKVYIAPKLTKLGSLTQIVNINTGTGADGGATPGATATT